MSKGHSIHLESYSKDLDMQSSCLSIEMSLRLSASWLLQRFESISETCEIYTFNQIYLKSMSRQWPIILLLLVLSLAASQQADDLDSDAQVVSSFLVDLIDKYDVSGVGAIPIDKYPSFLTDVFLTGNSVSRNQAVSDDAKQLLLDATTAFTVKYNGTEVGIQQFYMDLVKDFTIFLTQNEQKYSSLLETFFSDTPASQNQERPAGEKAQESAQL